MLISMSTVSMPHGMISSAGQTCAAGDERTAEAFGQSFASVLARTAEQAEAVL